MDYQEYFGFSISDQCLVLLLLRHMDEILSLLQPC